MRRFVTPQICRVFDESSQEYELISTIPTTIVVMNYSIHNRMKIRSFQLIVVILITLSITAFSIFLGGLCSTISSDSISVLYV